MPANCIQSFKELPACSFAACCLSLRTLRNSCIIKNLTLRHCKISEWLRSVSNNLPCPGWSLKCCGRSLLEHHYSCPDHYFPYVRLGGRESRQSTYIRTRFEISYDMSVSLSQGLEIAYDFQNCWPHSSNWLYCVKNILEFTPVITVTCKYTSYSNFYMASWSARKLLNPDHIMGIDIALGIFFLCVYFYCYFFSNTMLSLDIIPWILVLSQIYLINSRKSMKCPSSYYIFWYANYALF